MKTQFLKTRILRRSELKQINGGIGPLNPCNVLCPGGGVVSTRPGIGDVCNSDRSVCCICY
ncbi:MULTISPECIES: hypothetical protein [Chryseobacterium]|uniref:hypothetical protein n=1 Tax=Chryseobacterium TaxID=59732 RepID=UPI000AF560F1|nr:MULTISPECIES: hypothetical protein [Chryseobacterium]MBF6645186.1 hypothetical protein [Chryseobacterium indologenes]MBU3048077.1 hypothetical protein [Chryseobacterium indologenes]MEB4759462.1 hypothetical protein [Chryseobacterium indologenes]QIX83522.1 hypothetical protein FOB56_20760 [Chryseobacterium indologenes]QQQ71142.1 hypothetical protein JHW31_22190 [Chryseobacterium indologenes]